MSDNSQEIVQPIVWKDILGKDAPSTPMYSYVVPANEESIENSTKAIIFTVLTGKTLTDENKERIIRNQTDSKANDSLRKVFKMSEENSVLQTNLALAAITESKAQSHLAKEAYLAGKLPYTSSYDYWEGLVPIKSSVTVRKADIPNAGFVLIDGPNPRLGDIKGFPSVLIRREWFLKDNEAQLSFSSYLTKLDSAGLDAETVDKKLKQKSLPSHFRKILGFPRINQVLDSVGYVRPTDYWVNYEKRAKEELEIVYSNLKPEEQLLLQEYSAHEYLSAGSTIDLEHDGEKGRMEFSHLVIGAKLKLNPDSFEMEGDLSESKKIGFHVELRPTITQHSTHQGLLGLRESGLKAVEKMKL